MCNYLILCHDIPLQVAIGHKFQVVISISYISKAIFSHTLHTLVIIACVLLACMYGLWFQVFSKQGRVDDIPRAAS